MTRLAFTAILAAALPILAAFAGLSRALGAHPWWAVQTVAVGAAAGLAAALGLRAVGARRQAASAAAILTVVAFGVATLGKSRFAASYAEDHLAGLLWYYGWIATGACLTATLFLLLAPPRS